MTKFEVTLKHQTVQVELVVSVGEYLNDKIDLAEGRGY